MARPGRNIIDNRDRAVTISAGGALVHANVFAPIRMERGAVSRVINNTIRL